MSNLDITPFVLLLEEASVATGGALPEAGTLIVVIMGTLIAHRRRR